MMVHSPTRIAGPDNGVAAGDRRKSHAWWRARLDDISLILAVVLFMVVQSALADTPGTGELRMAPAGGGHPVTATLLTTRYRVKVSGLIADTRLAQQFHNGSDHWCEGTYVFPLPDRAAVYHLRMKVGNRVIEGHIDTRKAARKTYEKARRQGKRAALVDQERPNLFTTHIANIPPHGDITVELRYQETVRYRDGRFELRLPTTLTPRYMPGVPVPAPGESVRWSHGWARPTTQVPDADWISPYTVPASAVPAGSHQAAISIVLDAGLPIARVTSPGQLLDTSTRGNAVTVTPRGGTMSMDRDLVVDWQPVMGTAPSAAVFHEQWQGDDYSLVMVMPGHGKATQVLPREEILVIDTSGSMGGASIRQARAALRRALDSLGTGDRFNVIQFNSNTDQLFSDSRPANATNLAIARRYVDGLRAGGGTEMAPALAAALQAPSHDGWLRQVVFLTDGAVGNEAALFGLIHRELGSARLFTVGIGPAPNAHFMRQAARFGRGTFTDIDSLGEVEQRMDALFARLRSPVLSDFQLDWPDTGVSVYPRRIADLYQGEPVVIVARGVAPVGQLHIQAHQAGNAEGGVVWQRSLSLAGAAPGVGIHRLWARRRITALMDQKIRGADPDSIRKQVTALALKHQLASPWTSFVAVDSQPARPAGTVLHQKDVPTLLPAGMDPRMARFPQTGTVSMLLMTCGAAGLLLVVLLMLLVRLAPASGRVRP